MQAFNQQYLLRLAQAAQHRNKRLRSAKVIRPRPPLQLEREYAKDIIGGPLEIAMRLVRGELLNDMEQILASSSRARGDALHADDVSALILAKVRRVNIAYARTVTDAETEAMAKRWALRTGNHAKDYVARALQSLLKVDVFVGDPNLTETVNASVYTNATLIKDVGEEYIKKVQALTFDAVRTGKTWKELSAEIQTRDDISKNRATLIARDQIGKMNGQMNEAIQKNLGIEEYTWRTTRDGRVRPEHQERENQVYSWTKPPDGGHPGEAIQCRCGAEPNIDALLNSLGV